MNRLSQKPYVRWHNAIHSTAAVAQPAHGDGPVITAGAVVNADNAIGLHVIINTGATVDHDCVIGDFVHIAPGTHLAGGVKVDKGTLIGIGSAAIPNRTIGIWVTVGAGAVIVDNIPDRVVAKGVPARWE